MNGRGTAGEAAEPVDNLIERAQAAVAGARWLDALDLASQALAADPRQTEAALIVGRARGQLGAVQAAGAELRHVTVLCVDMARSTSIAARIGPEAMRQLMLELYELCAEAVARYEGRITKYSGDGVLAQFGHPIAHEDDPRRAVLAALAMLERVRGREADWRARVGEPIEVRVGLDSGLAAVGRIDSSPFSPEELAGDPPNVATRVQSTAEPMTIRISEATRRLVEGWFRTEEVGAVALRNYPRPIVLHRVLGSTDAETRLEANVHPRPALVNRTEELGGLRAAWNEAALERRHVVVEVTGEAGIGKSRLVEHLVATAVASGAAHATFSCSALHRASPLWPVSRALMRFFRVFPHEGGSDDLWLGTVHDRLAQLPGRQLDADRTAPVLARLLGVQSAVDLQPEELRRRTFDALIDLFEAMAARSMLVLAIEDADAADPSTRELISRLLARPEQPMLVLATSREPVQWLDADVRLELGPLRGDHVGELVRSVDPTLEDATVEAIVARADGVPYFAEELARAGSELPGPAAEPVALTGFLAARLDELGPELRALVSLVAVAGGDVRVQTLAQLGETPVDAVAAQVDELHRRGVVIRSSTPLGEVVRFRHALMRQVAYDGLLSERRTELHARIAELIAELPPGTVDPEDLARHLELAGDPAGAAPHWLAAAGAAAASGAHDEGRTLYERALAAIEQIPRRSPRRAPLELAAQLGLGAIQSTVAGYTSPSAHSAFTRALLLAESVEETAALIPALWGIWAYWLVLGEHTIAWRLAERCITIGEQYLEDERLALLSATIVGYQKLYLGDFPRAHAELRRLDPALGIEPPQEIPHDPATVTAATLPVASWFLGRAEDSRREAAGASALIDALPEGGRRTVLTRCFGGALLAWHASLDGDHAASLAYAQRAAALASEHGYVTWIGANTLHTAIALCGLGNHEQGLPLLLAVLDAWRGAGRDPAGEQRHPVLMTPYFAGRAAEALLATGAPEQALAELDRTLADTAANGERFWDAELLRLRAHARRACGEDEAASTADLEAAQALASEQSAGALVLRVQRDLDGVPESAG